MAEIATAYVSLVVSGDKVGPGVKKALGDTSADADRAGKSAGSRYGAAFGNALKAGAAIAGGLAIAKGVQFLGDSIEEAREAQVVGKRTENVIRSMGNASKISAKQVADLSGALSNKVGIDDEAIQSGANMLLTFGNIRNEVGKGNDIFSQTTGLMVDMSKAMGQDMQSSAVQLGKALNDPIKGVSALSRVGVSFSEQQTKQIKKLVETNDILGAQKIILGEVKRQFGGAGRAMSTPAERAQVAWGNLKEQVGTKLLPVLNKFQRWLAGKAIPAVSNFFDEMKSGKGTGGDVAKVLGNVRDAVKDAVPYIRKFVGYLGDVPSWAIKGGLGGLTALYGLKKLNSLTGGLGGKAVGGTVGKALGGGVQKVFETNPAALGGKGSGGTAIGGTGKGGKAVGGRPLGKIGAMGALALGGVAMGAWGADMPKLENKLKDVNAEMSRLIKSGGGTFLREVALRMRGVADASTIGAKSVAEYDAMQARAIRRDPAQAYKQLEVTARRTGVSLQDMTSVLPRTARAIDRSGAASKAAATSTNAWKKTVGSARQEVDKVDGRKPKVTWNNVGLLRGIVDSKRLDGNIKTVDGKKPSAFFSLPGIMSRIAEANRLDTSLTQAARDRSSTITISRRVVGAARNVAGIVPGFADGGRPPVGRVALVGERGPELFVPDRAGTIIPNNKLGGGGRTAITITNWATGEGYMESVADGRIRAHSRHDTRLGPRP